MICRIVPQVLPRWQKAVNWLCWTAYQFKPLSGVTAKVDECFASHLPSQAIPLCFPSKWQNLWHKTAKLSGKGHSVLTFRLKTCSLYTLITKRQ
jgi:hypothetical protein